MADIREIPQATRRRKPNLEAVPPAREAKQQRSSWADQAFDRGEFDEVGPLTISIAGIAMTLAAFVALQRFLAKRVPARRARRGATAAIRSGFAGMYTIMYASSHG